MSAVRTGSARRRPPAPVLIAVALPLLLALAVAGMGITARVRGVDAPPPADTRPLLLAPIDAPAASGPECAGVLAALPAELPGADAPLPARPLADPAPPGARAWTAAPRPVVLRCGLPRPTELTPSSALLEVNGVRWLRLDDGLPDPVVVTYVAVDRPVHVALTAPVATGSGPLQAVSDVVRATVPVAPVPVR